MPQCWLNKHRSKNAHAFDCSTVCSRFVPFYIEPLCVGGGGMGWGLGHRERCSGFLGIGTSYVHSRPPPTNGPPWTIDGAGFLRAFRGWKKVSIRALVVIFLSVPCSFPAFVGWNSMRTFFGGPGLDFFSGMEFTRALVLYSCPSDLSCFFVEFDSYEKFIPLRQKRHGFLENFKNYWLKQWEGAPPSVSIFFKWSAQPKWSSRRGRVAALATPV